MLQFASIATDKNKITEAGAEISLEDLKILTKQNSTIIGIIILRSLIVFPVS